MCVHVTVSNALYLIPPLFGFMVFALLSILALMRGGKSQKGRLFAGICVMGGLINLDMALVTAIPNETLALRIDRLIYVLFVFSIPLYIRFVHAYLAITRLKWLERTAYGLSVFFLLFTQTDYFLKGINYYPWGRIAKAGPCYYLFALAATFTVIYCLISLVVSFHRTHSSQSKNRIKYIIAGLSMSTFLILLNVLPVSGIPLYPLGNFSFIPAIVLAFGVLKYDLLDLDSVVWKSAIYGTLTVIMSLIYVVAIYLFNLYFINIGAGNPLLLPLVLSLFIVFLFDPLKNGIQRLFDRIFFRGKYEYRSTLHHMSSVLTSLLRRDEIVEFLLETIYVHLKVSGASLVFIDKSKEDIGCIRSKGAVLPPGLLDSIGGWKEIISYFESAADVIRPASVHKSEMHASARHGIASLWESTKTALIVPVVFQGTLKSLILLGEKRSGELFVPEDGELLSTIANQVAIALENAESYEKIESINLELERKVEERTAALKHALQEKETTQKQLIVSESLAAIGQLVAGTAHELNNPLSSASSLIETSIDTAESIELNDERYTEMIDDLRFSLKELHRAAHIVKSLLSLSRQTQTYTEPVSMNNVIDDALRVLNNRYKSLDVTIIRNYEELLPDIEGNFANLGQVCINIIKNALQALPVKGGTIELTTHFVEKNNSVHIACRDNGAGIEDRYQSKIFEPFFTTKGVGEGTGLGLYISHEIVRRHGGAITAGSERGKGTVVTITLPIKRRTSW